MRIRKSALALTKPGRSRDIPPIRLIHEIRAPERKARHDGVRVAHVVGADAWECVPHILALARRASSDALVVVVGHGGMHAELVRAGVQAVLLDLRGRKGTFTGLRSSRRQLHDFRPKVVQGWGYTGSLVGLALRLSVLRSAKLVWTVHRGVGSDGWASRLAQWVWKRLSGIPAAVVFTNQLSRLQHEALGLGDRPHTVIAPGFDTDRFSRSSERKIAFRRSLDIPQERFVVALIADGSGPSELSTVLRAASLAVGRIADPLFLIAGRGIDVHGVALREEVRRVGLHAHTLLLGEVEDRVSLMNGADAVTIVPPSHDAFPAAVGEAMACGAPCVIVDAGDCRHVAGRDAIVVRPRDPQALFDGWYQLYSYSRGLRDELGMSAAERVRSRFGVEEIARRYDSLYHSLLEVCAE